MSTFKIAVLTIFSVSIVFGIGIFAASKNRNSSSNISADIVVWGTISADAFNNAIIASSISGSKNLRVTYVSKDVSDFDKDFVEALAEGNGPDIVILREDLIYKNRNKLYPIPYSVFSQKDFKDKFIEQGELFLTKDGILSVPFIVDPMVMYWNRDLFSNNFISSPPKYWEELPYIIEKITKKDNEANVQQAAIAFGGWKNITNAKEILSMLLMQAGTPITSYNTNNTGFVSVLNQQFGFPRIPSQSAVDFYTQFSNPNSPNYTWNPSLPSSSNFFLSGNLAIYFGFASEIEAIQLKNSNLNYNVTFVPQIKDTKKKSVFAHMYGLSIVKQSKNISAAFAAINALTEPNSLIALGGITNLPPVRRDLLSVKQSEDYKTVFYQSALISHSWMDPDPSSTASTFRDMIESITSGRSRTTEALTRADSEINGLFK